MSAAPVRMLLFETTALFALRAVYFLLCRHFVSLSLFSNLKSVIREDGFSTGLESPELGEIALEDLEQGIPPSPVRAPSSSKGKIRIGEPGEAGPSSASAGSPLRPKSHPSPSTASLSRRLHASTQQNSLYPRMATALFCLSFSESCMLFTLVLFGEAVGDKARWLNWSMSLLALLFLIVFVIPLGLCLLLTHRTQQTPAPRTVLLTLVPFSVYIFLYYRVGSYIASKVVVEGAHSLGLINALLSRTCVPGVMLIASLSGGGAVNTAWEAFEWRSISSAEPVTDAQIISAERSLFRARMDIQQRTRSLALATSSAAREAETTASQSILSRWTSSTPAASHLASLEVELKCLEGMEGQMVKDVALLRKRKELREMGRTMKGRVWLALGWALSIYCVWRVFISCINLIFGYSQRHHHAPPVDGSPAPATRAGTDLITSLLGRLALLLNVQIDIATWSRLIGLVLIGSIILANMRNVLGSVSRIFKATSSGVSASFMLLFLAQLMSIYLLTSLISLPTSSGNTSSSTTSLLETLPSFQVFSRLFDTVFLVSAGGVFATRWVERKIRVVDDMPSQYS